MTRSRLIVDCGINILPKFWASCHEGEYVMLHRKVQLHSNISAQCCCVVLAYPEPQLIVELYCAPELIVECISTTLNEGEMSKLIVICEECDIQFPFSSVRDGDDERNQSVQPEKKS